MLRWLSVSQSSFLAHSQMWQTMSKHTSERWVLRSLSSRDRISKSTKRAPEARGELNEEITVFSKVRLIGQDGKEIGEMSSTQAVREAQKAHCDVLTVYKSSGVNSLPVVRLVDYQAMMESKRRNLYNSRKEKRGADGDERKATTIKQVRLSPSIDKHDFLLKIRQARNFLLEGYQLRLFMQFRRGQGRLQENAKETLSRGATELVSYGSLVGNAKGTDVDSLFPPEPAPDADDMDGGVNSLGEPCASLKEKPKAKPLEVFFQPFRKQVREELITKLQSADQD